MTPLLTIITPCSRPANLPELKASIQRMRCYQKSAVRWVIVHDANDDEFIPCIGEAWVDEIRVKGGIFGNLQRNWGMSLVADGYVYFLDDDTLMHPDFSLCMVEYLHRLNYAGAIIPQLLPDGTIRTNTPETVKVNQIDMAQVILKRSAIKTQFVQQYEADGLLIEEVFNKNRTKFLFMQEVKCYYNRLKKNDLASANTENV